jgi:hypothetical protein
MRHITPILANKAQGPRITGKVKATAPLWSKMGLRVISMDETAQYMQALKSCQKVGCTKGKHFFVGFNEVIRRIERGEVGSVALVKSGPTLLLNHVLEAAVLRGISIVMLPADSAATLSVHMSVSKLTVLGISCHGQVGGLQLQGSYRIMPSKVAGPGHRVSNRLGIARATQYAAVLSSTTTQTEPMFSPAFSSMGVDPISATLDGLRDLSGRLMKRA